MLNSLDMLHKLRDYKPTSHPNVIEEFMKTSVYFDFRNELVARTLGMQSTLSSVDSSNTFEDVMRTQGGLIAMELISGIFADLLHSAKTNLDHSEEDGHEEDL